MRKILKTLFAIKNEAGFTILEVLISMTLLSVGILGLASSAHNASHYQRQSKDMTQATMHATNQLEAIKRVATNEPTGGAFGFAYLVDSTASGYLNGYAAPDDWTRSSLDTIEGMNRSWKLNIYPLNSTDYDFTDPNQIRMVEAEVTVQWTNEKGQSKNVQLATVLHRRQFIQ